MAEGIKLQSGLVEGKVKAGDRLIYKVIKTGRDGTMVKLVKLGAKK